VDRVGIDVIGPLPFSKKNNKYILVIGDHFTLWMEAYPLPDQQSETIAQKLVLEIIPTLSTGWPTKYFCKAAFDFLFKDLNLLQTEQHFTWSFTSSAILYQ
jgi:hypothetical protein